MSMKTFTSRLIFVAVSVPLSLGAEADVGASEFAVLKARVAEQQAQIDQLREVLAEQSRLLDCPVGTHPGYRRAEVGRSGIRGAHGARSDTSAGTGVSGRGRASQQCCRARQSHEVHRE